ncbi:uncharacterized protein LOC143877779 isoform X2 [Tasmannia lanceolata]|uniref:uncharacterized protein LOC143877779 isoform X2 n=1 Tax=Tasmannia lanceolata TaxID=3420 RepID=UPI0040643C5C
MLRNKLLFRPDPPFSSFLHLQLSLLHPFPFPSSLSLHLHSLCWKLSRKWRLSCFSESADIYIVYQRTQSGSAAQVVKELAETLPVSNVVVDGELKSASLIVKAIDCGLRSVFLSDSNWRCIGDGYIVRSNFACSEEKNHIYALHVTVQADADDAFVLLVSPDVVRFSRHKIVDLLGSKMQERFHGGEEVIVDDYSLATSCSVLPCLYGGHVIGLSKFIPFGEDFKHMEELWSFKHGLALPNDYFVKIQFTHASDANKQWFPSAYVLQGLGLTPVPQTIRASKAVCALESFMKIVEAWDFFDGGLLKIKGAYRLRMDSDSSNLPGWTKASSNIGNQIVAANSNLSYSTTAEKILPFKGFLTTQDFRTPKPDLGHIFGNGNAEHIQNRGSSISSSKVSLDDTYTWSHDAVSTKATKFRPLFMRCIPAKRRDGISPSTKTDRILDQTCVPSVTGSEMLPHHKDGPFPTNGKATKEKHGYAGSSRRDHNRPEALTEQRDGDGLQLSSQTSRNEGNIQIVLDKGLSNPLADKHGYTEASRRDLNRPEALTEQRDGDGLQLSSQTSRNESNIQFVIDKGLSNPLADIRKTEMRGEILSNRKDQSREDIKQNMPKKRGKTHSDLSDITAKVIGYHASGQLGSLTVPELKTFLGTRKAKVGGKKEDLIQRIITLLA